MTRRSVMDRRVFVCVSLLENNRATMLSLSFVTVCLMVALIGLYVLFIMATGRQGNLVVIIVLAFISIPLGFLSHKYGIF